MGRVVKVSRWEHLADFLLFAALERRGRSLAGAPTLAAVVNDEIGRAIAVHGFYEKHLLLAIGDFLLPRAVPNAASSIALDIGANIGNHAIFFSRYFARVIAFEPNPTAAALLRTNLAANNIANVTVCEVGLSDRSETLAFRESPANLGAGRFLSNASAGRPGEKLVAVACGDDVLTGLQQDAPISFIKLDVEGFEERVLRGLAKTLGQHQPLVLYEAWNVEAATSVGNVLQPHGYKFFYSLDRPRISTKLRWLRRFHRLLAGADIHFHPIQNFGEWESPLLIASSRPISDA